MKQKPLVLAGVVCALIVLAVVLRVIGGSSHARPAPSAGGYYTGPMLNKAGTAIVTEDGKIVQRVPRGGPLPSQAGASAGARGNTVE